MRVLKSGLLKYSKHEIAQFKRACAILAKLGKAGAFLYLEEDSFHLMSGPDHDHEGYRDVPKQERIVESVFIPKASGGGW